MRLLCDCIYIFHYVYEGRARGSGLYLRTSRLCMLSAGLFLAYEFLKSVGKPNLVFCEVSVSVMQFLLSQCTLRTLETFELPQLGCQLPSPLLLIPYKFWHFYYSTSREIIRLHFFLARSRWIPNPNTSPSLSLVGDGQTVPGKAMLHTDKLPLHGSYSLQFS